ncbi:MAG: DUF4339 domain-containing protein [Verrucomicrobiota bacterium]
MSDDNYYVLIDSKEYGPYSLDRLKAMWVAGQITSDTLFAQPGMPQWEPVGKKLNNTKLGVFSVVEHKPYTGPIADLAVVPASLGEAWKVKYQYVIEDVTNPLAATGEWPADAHFHEALKAAVKNKAESGICRMASLQYEWVSGYTSHLFEILIAVCRSEEKCKQHYDLASGAAYTAFPGNPTETQWRRDVTQRRDGVSKIEGIGEEAVESLNDGQATLSFRRRNIFCVIAQKSGKSVRHLPQYEVMAKALDRSFCRG